MKFTIVVDQKAADEAFANSPRRGPKKTGSMWDPVFAAMDAGNVVLISKGKRRCFYVAACNRKMKVETVEQADGSFLVRRKPAEVPA